MPSEQPLWANLQVTASVPGRMIRPLAVSPIRPLSHLSLTPTLAGVRVACTVLS